MRKSKREYEWQKTENFGKFLHLLWDLGLIQRFLPERQDVLVLLCLLRYADFKTGECTVFIGKIADEAGIEHPTQVRRILQKIVKMGAFRRPPGRKGFKKINGKSACRFFRCTGKEVINHALANNLISKDRLRQIELHHAQEEIEAEAAAAERFADWAGDAGRDDMAGLEDVPETIDGLTN